MHQKRVLYREQEFVQILMDKIPNITKKDLEKAYVRHSSHKWSIVSVISYYKRKYQVKEWNKSKDKHYFRVRMTNGGTKYVYMCAELVEEFHRRGAYTAYEKV